MFGPTTSNGEFQFFNIRIKATGEIRHAERMPNGIYHVYRGKRFGLPAIDETFHPHEVENLGLSEKQTP